MRRRCKVFEGALSSTQYGTLESPLLHAAPPCWPETALRLQHAAPQPLAAQMLLPEMMGCCMHLMEGDGR